MDCSIRLRQFKNLPNVSTVHRFVVVRADSEKILVANTARIMTPTLYMIWRPLLKPPEAFQAHMILPLRSPPQAIGRHSSHTLLKRE